MSEPHILVTGSPVDGLIFWGPYDSEEAATDAGVELGANYWPAPLLPEPTSQADRSEVVWQVTLAMLDEAAGRQVTDEEARSVAKAMEFREDLTDLVIDVCGLPPDEDEHSDGDGCAIYQVGYGVYANGDTSGKTSVEDLEDGDTYQDPALDDESTWRTVSVIAEVGDWVHLGEPEDDADDEDYDHSRAKEDARNEALAQDLVSRLGDNCSSTGNGCTCGWRCDLEGEAYSEAYLAHTPITKESN